MLVLFGTETPIPTPSMTVNPDSVTPGPLGFAAIILIVVVVVLLIWDMNRRIRRVRYREEVRDELDAEEAAMKSAQSADAAASADPEANADSPADGAAGDGGTDDDAGQNPPTGR